MLETLYKKLILLLIFIYSIQSAFSQEKSIAELDSMIYGNMPGIESFQMVSHLDPDKAALYSAVLPGLGQIYNKQYWKLPIIYGGAILIGHYIKYNNDYYNAFRNAWIAETDGNDSTENPFGRFNESSLQRNAERFKRDRDFLIIVGFVYYILNIVDAHVAAHLIEFDINSDLAVMPTYQENTQYTKRNIGMSLVINLNK